jgi:DNA-binding GntR family transcriptional regulator
MPASLKELADNARRSYITVGEMVYNIIRGAIFSGIFLPGSRLPQDQIAETLGVSRMPVRAGLRRLESDGLVEFHPHRGATVRTLSANELAQIYELRIVVETYALQCVLEKITDEEIAEIEALITQMDSELEPRQWLENRQQFYHRLYQIADRPRLSELIGELRLEVSPYLLTLRVVDDHSEFIAMMRQRDVAGITNWMKDHLTEISQRLQRVIMEKHLYSETD